MSSSEKPIPDTVVRGRDRTPIAVSYMPNEALATRLLEIADEYRWRLIGLEVFLGQLPTNLDVGGALVATGPQSQLVVNLLERNIPVVRLGRMPHPLDELVPAVMPDRFAVGQLAAEHFAERGFGHVAFVGHPMWRYNRPFFRGLKTRARELGCECYLKRMHGEERPPDSKGSPESWRYQQDDFTQDLLKMPKPLGLLAVSDVTAGRYCRWLMEAGLRVPEDVAVLGIGNDRFLCKSALVSISSVAHNWDQILETAVGMLRERMEGKPIDRTCVQVPPLGVVTRPSTDVLAVSDPNVVKALRYMWDHIDRDLTVEKVVEHVLISRRSLERAFERELGRGIFAEFQRRRLDRACEMLNQTDLRIAQVSAALGFSSQNYFSQVFKRSFGVSPVHYRSRQH
ncbi:MAG: helix-turn-helix domain-containing protein [Phycisphaera sp.]|nr:helix-turn-helix domain-containing protein [Phycisphaera sp.]